MTDEPLVLVITPCFNQGFFLEETINSLLDQTYMNWECIIIDDGSVDNTKEVAQRLAKKYKKIKYLYQTNKGVSAARNNAIKHTVGKYILPLDADDLISPVYIEECVKIMESNENVKIVYCEAEKFGLQKGIWDSRDFDMNIMAYENMIFNSALFRRSDWEAVGGYEDYLVVGEDWELWINILSSGGSVYKLPFVGFYYRIHDDSKIQTYKWESIEYLNFIFKKHIDFFIPKLGNPIILYRENRKMSSQLRKLKGTYVYKFYKAFITKLRFSKEMVK